MIKIKIIYNNKFNNRNNMMIINNKQQINYLKKIKGNQNKIYQNYKNRKNKVINKNNYCYKIKKKFKEIH